MFSTLSSVDQFESTDDPLERITTAEAIRALIDYYRTSQHSYAANQNVEAISKKVSTISLIFLLVYLCYFLAYKLIINLQIYYRKELC